MLSATSLAACVAQRPKIVGLLQKSSAAREGESEQTALSPEERPVSTWPADGGHTGVTHEKPALKLPCWTFGKRTLPTPASEEEFLNSFKARFWPSAIPQDIYLSIQQALHKCFFLSGVILAAHVEEEVKAQRSKDAPRQRSETEPTQSDSLDTQASLSAHCLGLNGEFNCRRGNWCIS